VQSSSTHQNVIRGLSRPGRARKLFEQNTGLVASTVAQPILNSIENGSGLRRNLRICLLHQLSDDARSTFSKIFPFPLPLPACELRGDLFRCFCQKLNAFSL